MNQETKIVDNSVNDLEKQVETLDKLIEINSLINSTLDMGKLLNIIMETIKDIMGAEASTLLLFEERTEDLVFKVALGEAGEELTEKYRVNIGQGVAGWVAENRKPIYINDVYKDERFDPNFDKKTGFNTKSILCVPLLYKGKLLGVIQAINPITRAGFNDKDLALFLSFADQAVIAVQNAIFFKNALEEHRIKNEISAAKSFQESLLPAISKQYNNIQIAAKTIPAREVGGEFYDLFYFDNNTIGVAVGDINKKGIPGALFASILSGAIKALSTVVRGNPLGLMKHLNKSIRENIEPIENASLFYGLISCIEKNIQFVNAGFAYPILVRKNVARYLKFECSALGEKDVSPKKINVKFKTNDFFIIVTDGIVNLKNRGAQNLGLKRIMDHLNNSFETSQDVVDSLNNLADNFLKGLEKKEDISIIVFKIGE